MFKVLDLEALSSIKSISNAMFRDRASQFVGRHQWALSLAAEGFEIDEFDDARTTYCIVEQDLVHQASLRLRQADAGSMVERHFSRLWERSADRLRGGVEVTRFCAAPSLTPDQRLAAVSDLLLGLCRHCQRSGVRSFFGVVFPPVLRVIRQSGWEPEVLDRLHDERGTMVLCEWTPSELVSWSIQECREFREQCWMERRVAHNVTDTRLVA